MSYVPSHINPSLLAQPQALTIIEHTTGTSQTITVGNRVQLGTVHNWYGSFSPTIATNKITLPSGYHYYVESTIQAYQVGSFNLSAYVTYKHYDETNTADIGVTATTWQAGSGPDYHTFARDSVARALIDCTSSGIDLSLKISASLNCDRINYNSDQYIYAGLGRSVIWQLEG